MVVRRLQKLIWIRDRSQHHWLQLLCERFVCFFLSHGLVAGFILPTMTLLTILPLCFVLLFFFIGHEPILYWYTSSQSWSEVIKQTRVKQSNSSLQYVVWRPDFCHSRNLFATHHSLLMCSLFCRLLVNLCVSRVKKSKIKSFTYNFILS